MIVHVPLFGSRSWLEQQVALGWTGIGEELDTFGFATTGALLDAEACHALMRTYDDDTALRSHVVMRCHGFGEDEYKYFAYPLPDPVERLRQAVYPKLAPIANRWIAMMGMPHRYPETLDLFLARCHQAGQWRPTSLRLKYRPGDYNCLHQDLYGEQVFPIQLAVLLSEPGTGFEGGDFVLTEQRPRIHSRTEVVPLARGGGGLFAVSGRPKQGIRGTYRIKMRRSVSRVRRGHYYTTGIIFHDAA